MGRDYESIHRTSTTVCSIADTDEKALEQIPEAMRRQFGDRITATSLIGSPTTIRQRLANMEEAGIQELIIAFANRTDPEQLRFFAREFIG